MNLRKHRCARGTCTPCVIWRDEGKAIIHLSDPAETVCIADGMVVLRRGRWSDLDGASDEHLF
jgi:hypothetical protein